MVELAEAPPHPTVFAFASAVDLSPHAGRGERMAPVLGRRGSKPKRIEAAE
jgi:hypothetical protein